MSNLEFSSALVSKYQEYMLRKHNVSISDSQTQLDLDSLSNLYLLFSKQDNEISREQS